MESNLLWWQQAVIYQVYPRSFNDSNGDGIGDLKGIKARLDYLEWLGIDAIWISPVYPSPMADFGYDISDYKGIHPIFGTMADFDELLEAVHKKGMKLLLDYVPNHTSDQHPWFIASRSSIKDPKRDWYIWKDAGPNGEPPNNWLSVFGGKAWEWEDPTHQYYYHAFLKEQPDLNWRNPEVKKAMFDVLEFWLKKGVDGFRIDVLWHIIKDEMLRDNPHNPDYQQHMATYEQLLPVYSTDQPEVHEIVKEMRALLDRFQERVMIGEIYLPISKLVTYYGENNNGVHLPFNFQLIVLPWNAMKVAAAISEYEASLPDDAWPNWVLGNHDQPRIASRVGRKQARNAALLLLTLRGTPTIYYGEETGMENVFIPEDEIQDPQGLNMPGKHLSRDPYRTPMLWNESGYGGFSVSKPWLRTGDLQHNVARQQKDPLSMLNLYRRIIHIRKQSPSLIHGDYLPVHDSENSMAFERKAEGHGDYLVALNFSADEQVIPLKNPMKGRVLINTISLENKTIKGDKIVLAPHEGLLVEKEA